MFGDCSANFRWLFSEYSAISHWSSLNIRGALFLTKHRQWFAKNFNVSIENFGHREMLPHEFRLSVEGSVIPPEHRLMLVKFHRECIGDAKKAQWDRAITYVSRPYRSRCLLIYLKAPTQATLCLNFVTVFPEETEIWPKMWFCHAVTLKGEGHPGKFKRFSITTKPSTYM